MKIKEIMTMFTRIMMVLWVGVVFSTQILAQNTEPLPPFHGAVWHPTANQVAFYSADTVTVYTGELQELYSFNIPPEASEARAIRIPQMEWSPDGNKIAASIFRSVGDGGFNRVLVWDLTTSPPSLIFNQDNLMDPITWAPDSQHLAGLSLFGGNALIEVYNVLAGNLWRNEFRHIE